MPFVKTLFRVVKSDWLVFWTLAGMHGLFVVLFAAESLLAWLNFRFADAARYQLLNLIIVALTFAAYKVFQFTDWLFGRTGSTQATKTAQRRSSPDGKAGVWFSSNQSGLSSPSSPNGL